MQENRSTSLFEQGFYDNLVFWRRADVTKMDENDKFAHNSKFDLENLRMSANVDQHHLVIDR